MCFQKDGRTAQDARCIASRIVTKAIDYFLSIDTFEQKCAVLKGMLQSLRLIDHVKTIGIYQSLINDTLYEHKCLQNINKLYKHDGKCDDQKQFKDIHEAAMVSTLQGFTDNSIISPMKPTPVKKPSAIKSLCLFTNILDMKMKTTTRQIGASK